MVKTSKVHHHLISFTIIFLVTFGIYWNSLQGDFIWDDKDLILNHQPYLGDWKNLCSAFTEPFFGKASTYRPLLILSFIFDYHLWGLNPFGFHYTNVLLHSVNGFLVYLLAVALFSNYALALSASLLFAAHPIQTEAVAWISGRNDIILAFFSLLTLFFYVRLPALSGVKRAVVIAGLLFGYGLTLLTKESGLVLILLIALVDVCFRVGPATSSGTRRRFYLSLILISLLYLLVRMFILGKVGIITVPSEEGLYRRLLGLFVTYAYYFKMLLYPLQQTANPFMPYLHSLKDPLVIFSLLLVLSLLLLTVACWKYFREVSFIVLWVFISLLPVSGIVPLTVPVLEHRLYLGVVGFSMALPLLLLKVSPGKRNAVLPLLKKATPFVLLAIMLSLYCAKTVTRNTVWKNESHFWQQTVHDSPLSVFAHNNLGHVYAQQGYHEKALQEFERALSLNPRAANVYASLGALYVEQGLYLKGIEAYEKALSLKPRRATLYNCLGRVYYRVLEEHTPSSTGVEKTDTSTLIAALGIPAIYQKCEDNYHRALQLNPDDAEAHNNLGDLYYWEGSYEGAAEAYTRALQLNPYLAEAHNNLGLVFFEGKRYDDAQREFMKAVQLKPDFGEAHNNLALVHLQRGLYQNALRGFTDALALMPENADIYFNLALVYFNGFHDTEKSIYYLRASLESDPHHVRVESIKAYLNSFESQTAMRE